MYRTIEQHRGFVATAAGARGRGRLIAVVANAKAEAGAGSNWPATKPMHHTTTCDRPRGASPQT